MPRVLVMHAYSAANVGDGLLVRLAHRQVERALGPCTVKVVATEADTFAEDGVVQWRPVGFPAGLGRPAKRAAFLSALTLPASGEVARLAQEADLVVAVGGGYLRGGSATELVKSLGAHGTQVRLLGRHHAKTVYLPQSIGPFAPPVRRLAVAGLGRMAAVHVRDDRSVVELAGAGNVRRTPDLAVIEFAGRDPSGPSPARLEREAPVLLVARDLARPRDYYATVEGLVAQRRTEVVVQSSVGGNDDTPLSQRLQGGPCRPLATALREARPQVVVSTRLHGSMAALLAGWPTVHLSYERKGWGAFEDMGLDDFVLNARSTSPEEVGALVDRIHDDPAAYWRAAARGTSKIQERAERMRDDLRRAARA